MIEILRSGKPEELEAIRAEELIRVRALRATAPLKSKHLGTEYGVARSPLFLSQQRKCCYCEKRVEDTYEDVEHHRPKVIYWWLTWSWENLLYACPQCNRSGKAARFPLVVDADRLVPEDAPPGQEQPLLLDPTRDSPVGHIQFRRSKVAGREIWRAYARAGSRRGMSTVEVIGLNRDSLINAYRDHVNDRVRPRVENLKTAMAFGDLQAARKVLDSAKRQLLRRASLFAALSFDALRELIPTTTLEDLQAEIPRPPID